MAHSFIMEMIEIWSSYERKKEFHVWLFKDKGASFYLYELTIMCGYFKTIYI